MPINFPAIALLLILIDAGRYFLRGSSFSIDLLIGIYRVFRHRIKGKKVQKKTEDQEGILSHIFDDLKPPTKKRITSHKIKKEVNEKRQDIIRYGESGGEPHPKSTAKVLWENVYYNHLFPEKFIMPSKCLDAFDFLVAKNSTDDDRVLRYFESLKISDAGFNTKVVERIDGENVDWFEIFGSLYDTGLLIGVIWPKIEDIYNKCIKSSKIKPKDIPKTLKKDVRDFIRFVHNQRDEKKSNPFYNSINFGTIGILMMGKKGFSSYKRHCLHLTIKKRCNEIIICSYGQGRGIRHIQFVEMMKTWFNLAPKLMTISKTELQPKLRHPALHTFLDDSTINPYPTFTELEKKVEFLDVIYKQQIQDIPLDDVIGVRFIGNNSIKNGIEFLGEKIDDYKIILATDTHPEKKIPILKAILEKKNQTQE